MRHRFALIVGLVAAPAALVAQTGDYPKSPPPAAPVKPASFPPFQEATLTNGVRLVVVESHEQPVLSVTLSVPAGSAYDARGKEGQAAMVAQLLTKGAGSRSAEEFAAAIEGVGGTVVSIANDDFLTLRADVLSPNAALAFDLMADAIVRPTFPQTELELLRTQTLTALQLEQSQPAALAQRYFARTLYGQHPYARRPTAASIRAITRQDLVSFQGARLRPAGALLVVAGDITLDSVRSLATAAFAAWTGGPAAAGAFATPPARTRSEILLVHRPGSVQSNILVGNTTFAPADPRYFAATMANRVLGGGADSRLFTILREQKGWTYGSYSQLSRPKGLGSFVASAEVRTEVTDSALVEMLAQLRKLGREPVPASELEAAKGALVGSFPLSIETATQVANAVSQAKLLGLPADYLRTYRTRLASVTPAQLQTAARAVIRPEASVIVVVGDGAKIYNGLSKVAPVRMVSVEGTPLTADDLVIKAAALDLDMGKLVARRDSFTVIVQGNPFGWQRSALEKTDSGFKYTDESVIGPIAQQTTVVTFTDKIEMGTVKQTGKVQGQDVKIDVTYAGGRAKGSAATPTPNG
ncbi:MAG TPA: pitrilysin family protein, partial [Gemmatimonadaceae bacterium]|nr:pitrilysin family protein [Gemmatimonadaceae bacterium]